MIHIRFLWGVVLATPGFAQPQFEELIASPSVGQAIVFSTRLTDLDGDQDLDLVVAGNSSSRRFLNDGTGRFLPRTTGDFPASVRNNRRNAIGDIDGDGDEDIITGGQLHVLINDGQGDFQEDGSRASGQLNRRSIGSPALADLDDDGDLDLVFSLSNLRLVLNDGTGRFHGLGTGISLQPAEEVYVFDVDSDGDSDILTRPLIQNSNDRPRLLLQEGTGNFVDRTITNLPFFLRPRDVATGDIDGDGDPDIVLSTTRNFLPLVVWRNQGGGVFVEDPSAVPSTTTRSGRSLALADVDEDGDLDAILAASPESRLFVNDGQGVFTEAPVGQMPLQFGAIQDCASGDIDSDGDQDFIASPSPAGTGFAIYANLFRHTFPSNTPGVGGTLELRLDSRYDPNGSFGFAFPALSDRAVDQFVPGLGRLGLDPAGLVSFGPALIGPPSGTTTIAIPVPQDPTLSGRTFHAQTAILRWPGSAAALTNRATVVIQ